MFRRTFLPALCGGVLAAIALATPASAACTPDPQGDFLSTYTGPQISEVDIRCIDVRLDHGTFKMTATADGPIGVSPLTYFVWGINRGAGVPRLQFIGTPPALRPDLPFDAIALSYPSGSADFTLLPPPTFVNFPGIVSVSGNQLTLSLPLSWLPSNGFVPKDYEFTVWTDYQLTGALGTANNSYIGDFSPTVHAAVPEPASWAMMLGGFALVGGTLRMRRKPTIAFG